MPKQDR